MIVSIMFLTSALNFGNLQKNDFCRLATYSKAETIELVSKSWIGVYDLPKPIKQSVCTRTKLATNGWYYSNHR